MLCSEIREYFVQGACDHVCTCLECAFKLRSLDANKKCMKCTRELDSVFVVSGSEGRFANFSTSEAKEFGGSIFAVDEKSKSSCVNLTRAKCSQIYCENRGPYDLEGYSEHIRRQHSLFLCSLCSEHRLLLLSEQATFTRERLDAHFQTGDFDDEENLIFMHPFCGFCSKHFFNETIFMKHMREDHARCDLCTDESSKYRFYRDIRELAGHLGRNHFVCTSPECSMMMSAFKSNEQLQRHLVTVHKKGTVGKVNLFEALPEPPSERSETMGLDISDCLLSLRKAAPKVARGGELPPELSLFELMDHLVDFRLRSFEEERRIVEALAHNREVQGQTAYLRKTQEDRISFEEIRFGRLAPGEKYGFEEFEEDMRGLLRPNEASELIGGTVAFLRGHRQPSRLFEVFARLLGLRLGIKYFYLYSHTLPYELGRVSLAFLHGKVRALPLRANGPLKDISTWLDFFRWLGTVIAQEIKRRVFEKEIDLKDPELTSERNSVFIRSVKTLSLRDAVGLKFLQNFVLSDSKRALQRLIFANADSFSEILTPIPAKDLLLINLYLKIATPFFQGRHNQTQQVNESVTNLLDWFFDDHKDVARRVGYSLTSSSGFVKTKVFETQFAEEDFPALQAPKVLPQAPIKAPSKTEKPPVNEEFPALPVAPRKTQAERLGLSNVRPASPKQKPKPSQQTIVDTPDDKDFPALAASSSPPVPRPPRPPNAFDSEPMRPSRPINVADFPELAPAAHSGPTLFDRLAAESKKKDPRRAPTSHNQAVPQKSGKSNRAAKKNNSGVVISAPKPQVINFDTDEPEESKNLKEPSLESDSEPEDRNIKPSQAVPVTEPEIKAQAEIEKHFECLKSGPKKAEQKEEEDFPSLEEPLVPLKSSKSTPISQWAPEPPSKPVEKKNQFDNFIDQAFAASIANSKKGKQAKSKEESFPELAPSNPSGARNLFAELDKPSKKPNLHERFGYSARTEPAQPESQQTIVAGIAVTKIKKKR